MRTTSCGPAPPTLQHAGGFQTLGDVAAIPLEQAGHDAVVQFWDLETPTRPALLSTLTGLESWEAGAAGLAVTDDGDHLLVVGRADSQVLDFYTSQSDLAEADFTHAATWRSSDGLAAGSIDRNFGNDQTLNLLRQEDGTMHLLGFHRSGIKGEVGQDWVDLFTATLSGSSVSLKKVAKRHMTATRGHFQKGAGVYVRADDQLDDFKGRRIELQPGQQVSDYKQAPGGGFGDSVSSVRFQLPAGTNYTLYEHDGYRGRHLVLQGTGRVVEIRDLGAPGYRFEDEVSSSK